MNFETILKKYDYSLKKEQIALKPASPRESARLLVYNRKTRKTAISTFANILKYLPKRAVLVFNKTKVYPARLTVQKPSGGKAEILYINHDNGLMQALSNKKLEIGSIASLIRGRGLVRLIKFEILKKEGQIYYLKPNFPTSKIKQILTKYGQTPLPPYLKHSPLKENQRRKEYQTVFAKGGLSVAAPTASLHFTKKLLSNLKKKGIDATFVNLDVNLGTFAPLKKENFTSNKLHTENFFINKKTAQFLNEAKKQKRPIIAVGTTALRTLESAGKNRKLNKLFGSTSLFIKPGFEFNFADGLITNFHVPKSSLLMLVAALLGEKQLFWLYEKAKKNNFKFFSFGDGMLIF